MILLIAKILVIVQTESLIYEESYSVEINLLKEIFVNNGVFYYQIKSVLLAHPAINIHAWLKYTCLINHIHFAVFIVKFFYSSLFILLPLRISRVYREN